jgi:DnaK suppressor protein
MAGTEDRTQAESVRTRSEEDDMPSVNRSLLERLAYEEREVRRQVIALRRTQQGGTAVLDRPAGDSANVFELALQAVAGQHDEIVRSRLAEKLRALADAQDRLREGTYGLCQVCGGRIPRRRLEAMPTATLCVRCQEEREAARAA